MYFYKLIISFIFVINAFPSGFAADDETAWKEFKQTYQKRYLTRTDELNRKQIFLENKHFIDKHNDDKSDGYTFTSGLNNWSDLTAEEFNKLLNGFKPGLLGGLMVAPNAQFVANYLQKLNVSMQTRFVGFDDLSPPSQGDGDDNSIWESNSFGAPYVRKRLDWREYGRVMKVKDQGSCGSCWAFATVGCLEGILASRGYYTLLSEQNLLDCSGSYGNEACNGGFMDAALRYVRDHGIMTNCEYKYEAKKGKCRFQPRKSVMRVYGAGRLPKGNSTLLKEALNLIGPLPIAVDASLKSFHSYKKGIYNDKECKHDPNHMNHAILLIGYGTDQSGQDYWIAKNSWGTSWGENGFIRISQKENLCGVSTYAIIPLQRQ